MGRTRTGRIRRKRRKAPVVTHHEVTIGGKLIKYTATAGYLELPDYEGKPKANVFCVSYVKDVPEGEKVDWGTRPITYAFNGGPGSSSVWLHWGAGAAAGGLCESEREAGRAIVAITAVQGGG
jgi:carboxypeptidase C (cathepsin A)